MRLTGKNAELFNAFSRITVDAYQDDRLLSCAVLSKAPNYGNILERFLEDAVCSRPTLTQRTFLWARYIAVNAGHFLFLLMARLMCLALKWDAALKTPPGEQPRAVLDVFALLPRLAAEGTYRDFYLPGLASHARHTGFSPMYLYRLYGSRNPKILYRALKALRESGPGIADVCLLKGTDWLRLLWHTATYPLSHCRLVRRLERNRPAEKSPEAYILQALYGTVGSNVLAGELARLAGLRLAEALSGRAGDRVISWYENQTVNKAFYRGVRQGLRSASGQSKPYGNNNTVFPRFIGAQLLVWPEALLNNHPDDGEAALGLAPDKVVVNGRWFLPENTTQEYAVGPALRYGDVFKPMGCGSEAAAPGPLLVLLSYHPEETKRVLALVLPLARQGRAVAYKFHPAANPADYAEWLPEEPVFAEKNLYAALGAAGAVIGSGSGALAEAAARGVPVLAVEACAGVTLNYLPALGEGVLWEKIRSQCEMEGALGRLLEARRMPGYGEQVRAFRDALFAEPTAKLVTEAFELKR